MKAVQEILGEAYDPAVVSVNELKKATGFDTPQQFLDDLRTLNGGDLSNASNEARCVAYTEIALETVGLMTPEEYEQMGGCSIPTVLCCSITTDETGKTVPGEYLTREADRLKSRKSGIDMERLKKVKETLLARIKDEGMDEQALIQLLIQPDAI